MMVTCVADGRGHGGGVEALPCGEIGEGGTARGDKNPGEWKSVVIRVQRRDAGPQEGEGRHVGHQCSLVMFASVVLLNLQRTPARG